MLSLHIPAIALSWAAPDKKKRFSFSHGPVYIGAALEDVKKLPSPQLVRSHRLWHFAIGFGIGLFVFSVDRGTEYKFVNVPQEG